MVLLVTLAFYLLIQGYLFYRIKSYLYGKVRDRVRQRLLSTLVASFFLFMLLPFFWRAHFGWQQGATPSWFVRPLFTLFAIWGFGSTGSALILLGYGFFRRLVPCFAPSSQAPDRERRRLLKAGLGLAAMTPFLVSGYGTFLGRRRFEIEEFELPIEGLSSSLSQLSVVQLTDIHMGNFMPAEELAGYVEAVNRLQPDLIALTGDFVSVSLDEARPCVETLAGLKARYGVFACIGNHDVYAGADEELTGRFGEKGIRVLRNDAVSIRIGDTKLNVLGIDDLLWARPDLARALRAARRDPGEVQLLLSHRPEIFPEAARNSVDAVLSGHYHGGQVKLGTDPQAPSIARLITPYAEGLFRLPARAQGGRKGSLLFVSRGIGTTGLPIRINCPPQIAHLRLIKS